MLLITVSLVRTLINFFEIILCISALLSWFPVNGDSVFIQLVDRICGVLLYPARILVGKSEFLASLPIDISYIITFIGLSIISSLLPAVFI